MLPTPHARQLYQDIHHTDNAAALNPKFDKTDALNQNCIYLIVPHAALA